MSDITLNIDGREVKAKEGMTVLEAARSADIFIPTLCHNEMLEPYGGCRLCTVEAETRGRTKLVAACLFPVQADLIVRTRSETVDKIRKLIIGVLACPCTGFRADERAGCRVWCGQGSVPQVILVLHPLWTLCQILCRGQKEKRHRVCR